MFVGEQRSAALGLDYDDWTHKSKTLRKTRVCYWRFNKAMAMAKRIVFAQADLRRPFAFGNRDGCVDEIVAPRRLRKRKTFGGNRLQFVSEPDDRRTSALAGAKRKPCGREVAQHAGLRALDNAVGAFYLISDYFPRGNFAAHRPPFYFE